MLDLFPLKQFFKLLNLVQVLNDLGLLFVRGFSLRHDAVLDVDDFLVQLVALLLQGGDDVVLELVLLLYLFNELLQLVVFLVQFVRRRLVVHLVRGQCELQLVEL